MPAAEPTRRTGSTADGHRRDLWRPTVTVLTATFDRAELLPELYASLCAQTFRDFEWLVIDDGSTDQTPELLHRWQHSAPFEVRWIRQENAGRHVAVNRGVQAARGEYIAVIDSDDTYLPTGLATLVGHFSSLAEGERAGLANIEARASTPTGSLIGEPLPAATMDSDNLRGHRDVRLVDTLGMYRTAVLRAYPFPEDLGRFVPEALVWNRIATRYGTRFISDVVGVKRYQPDGLSARSRAVRVGESRAYRCYYRELLGSGHALPAGQRLRANVGYIRCCLHLGMSLAAQARDVSSLGWWLVALPLGVLAWARDRWALRRETSARGQGTPSDGTTLVAHPGSRGWVALASGGQMAALAVGAATNLLYARLLRPEQLGQLALVLTIAGLAMVLTELGLHNWLTRALSAGEVALADGAALVVKLTPTLAALVGLVAAVVLSRLTGLGALLGLSASQAWLIPELAVGLALYQAALTLTQGSARFRERAVVPLCNAVLTLALTAAALLTWSTVEAAVHATAVAYLVVATWFIARTVRGEIIARIDGRLARRAVREARPLWWNTLLSFATSAGDILIARSVLSLGDVGYYHIVKKIAVAGLAPLTALLPMLFARMSAASSDTVRVRRYRSYHGWLTTAFAAGMVLAAPWIVPVMSWLFGDPYAARYVALLVLSGALWLQATHDLLGYLLAASKAFAAPLAANASVVVTAASLALLLRQLQLAEFALLLAVAHLVGTAVMVAAARRRRLAVSVPILLLTVVLAGATLGLAGLLVTTPLPLAVPASLLGAGAAVAALVRADPMARAWVRSRLRTGSTVEVS